MLERFIKNYNAGKISRIPLPIFLILPFLVQVWSIVGLVGYLSYQSGQQAVTNLANQLMTQTAQRVSNRLDNYLYTPHQLVSLNAITAEQGALNLEDITQLEKHFWRQIQTFKEITDISFTSTTGWYLAVGQDKTGNVSQPGSVIIAIGEKGKRLFFLADGQGNRTRLVQSLPNWNVHDRPWYRHALQQPVTKQFWSPILPWVGLPVAGLRAILPRHQNGRLLGFWGSNILLNHISLFLSKLQFSPNGQVFIIERSGDLVATSTQEQPFIKNIQGKTLIRLAAINSQDWLTRTTTQAILQQTQGFSHIQTKQSLTFIAQPPISGKRHLHRQRYFTQVVPYRDQYGLDWLIVLTIPETDFMDEIYKNVQRTIIWVAVALLGAIGLGIYTARWITQPVVRLQNAATAVAHGSFDTPLPQTPIIELQHLSDAFVEMGYRLSQSFQAMEALNQELSESEARLRKFLESLPIGVKIHAANGQLIYINQAGRKFLKPGLSGQATLDEQFRFYEIYIAGTNIPYPIEQSPVSQALAGQFAKTEDLEIQIGENRIIFEVQATPVSDAEGKVTHAIVAFQDITDRKKVEQVLANYNHELEREVRERTLALEIVNTKLEQLAQTDALTQIANRRHFDQRLQQEWQRLQRDQKPLSLLLLDVDYFKRYNDFYGHQMGDSCLVQIAQAMRQAVYRTADLVARYGGEEFVVVLPETKAAGAITIANRIQEAISVLAIPHQTSEASDIVTVSIGIATLIPFVEGSPELLISQADHALYDAKQQGRNRSVAI
jgi:diguanylate cyclase (GGDEF)-like protein